MTRRPAGRASLVVGLALLAIGAAIVGVSARAWSMRQSGALVPLLSPPWATSKLAPLERVMIHVDGGFGFSMTNSRVTNSRFLGSGVHRISTTNGAVLTTHLFVPPNITAARSWGVVLGTKSFCWWWATSPSSVTIGCTPAMYIAPFGAPFLALGARRVLAWRNAARRSRTGRCFACGYSRVGLPTGAPCPECGAAV